MGYMCHRVFCLVYFGIVSIATSRPVSYTDGVALMQRNQFNWHSFHIHYSPDFRQSLGFKINNYSESKDSSVSATYNRLLYRKNGTGFQANLYMRSGLGSFINTKSPAILGSFSADFETRRLYSAIEIQRYGLLSNSNQWMYSGALGFLPILASAEQLNVWFLIRYDYSLSSESSYITPLVRFMYLDKMVEIGTSFHKIQNRIFFTWEVIF